MRTLLSYFVLIFVPVVSLAIAILPYWWVKKHYKLVQWKHLWIALSAGIVVNVGWWWVIFSITNERISIYLLGTESDGVLLSFFLISFFIIITPFIFTKLHYGSFTAKRTIMSILIAVLTAGFVLGIWLALAIVGYRGIFYQLN